MVMDFSNGIAASFEPFFRHLEGWVNEIQLSDTIAQFCVPPPISPDCRLQCTDPPRTLHSGK